MSDYQQKVAICAKKQECITQSLEKQNKRNFPWGKSNMHLLDNDFNLAILNMFKDKEDNKKRTNIWVICHQVENINE